MPPTSSPTPRRRPRLRFTLRALLITITLFMLWGGYHTNRGRRERAAIEVLRERGAVVTTKRASDETTWDYTAPYHQVVTFLWGKPSVTFVAFYKIPNAAEINALHDLPHLNTIYAHLEPGQRSVPANSAVTQLLKGQRLTMLSLLGWELSDEDSEAIAAQHTLVHLGIAESTLSEAGLAKILQLPRLTSFGMDHCPVTGAELGNIPGAPQLETLVCDHCPLDPTFAAFVSRCPSLTGLGCCHSPASDDFLASLAPNPRLKHLRLARSQITSASFPAIKQFPALEYLNITSPNLTDEDQAELKTMLPGVQVVQ